MGDQSRRNNRPEWLAGWIGLAVLIGSLIGDGAVVNAWGKEPKEQTAEKARQLGADVVSPDAEVRGHALIDLINGNYRELTDDQRLAAVLLAAKSPISTRRTIRAS